MTSVTNPFIVHFSEKKKKLKLNLKIAYSINPKSCFNHINDVFKIEKANDGKLQSILASEDVIMFLEKLLGQIHFELKAKFDNLENLTEVLKALRNCTTDFKTQQFISLKTKIIEVVNEVFKRVVEIDDNHISLKILLQFLVNLVSSNKVASAKVYSIFDDSLAVCLSHKIYTYETSALVYNISLSELISDSGVIISLLSFYDCEHSNEFVKFYLEHIVITSDFWKTYQHLILRQKVLTLTILRDLYRQDNRFSLHDDGLNALIKIFLMSSNIFFQIDKSNDLRIHESALCLEILSSLSSNDEHLLKFQNNKDILITAGVLLINIHRLGKQSVNCFTPVQKLSEFGKETELQDHPAFGFKADLIRLIGNMCWKSIIMQDLARLAELIPVILESTNMDARNPFITQWCILAIRNLCDGNIENQRFIARLHHKGTVSSEVLEEMGLTLSSDGENQIKVIPLDSLNDRKV